MGTSFTMHGLENLNNTRMMLSLEIEWKLV